MTTVEEIKARIGSKYKRHKFDPTAPKIIFICPICDKKQKRNAGYQAKTCSRECGKIHRKRKL